METLGFFRGKLMTVTERDRIEREELQAEYDRYENMTEEEYDKNNLRGDCG